MTENDNNTEEILSIDPNDSISAPERNANDFEPCDDGEKNATPEEKCFDLDEEAMALSEEFPALGDGTPNMHFDTARYEELRALGVTPREAFLATAKQKRVDDRAHLSGSMPKRAYATAGGMTAGELKEARAIFGNISDEEIRSLYRRVTK